MTEEATQAGQETTQTGTESTQAESSQQSGEQQTQQGEQTQQSQQGGESQQGQQGEQPGQGEQQTSGDESEASSAPETYEDFSLPEGVQLDQQTLEKFTPLAKELGLNQEQAQKLVDLQADLQQTTQKSMEDAVAKQHEEWLESAKNDEELGGEKFDQNVETARKAIETFGTPELKQFLDDSGLGNHPEMIRMARRIGEAISEDTLTPGGNGHKEASREEVLYPNQAKK